MNIGIAIHGRAAAAPCKQRNKQPVVLLNVLVTDSGDMPVNSIKAATVVCQPSGTTLFTIVCKP
jgi:hypothetical protein